MTIALKYPFIRTLVKSSYLDILGAVLVFAICFYKDFHGTIYYNGKITFGVPIYDLFSHIERGAYPLGITAMIGAVFSLLATRFTGKQSTTGPVIGLMTTINSGVNDFLFGNASAIISYPITFVIFTFIVKRWSDGVKMRQRDLLYYLILFLGMVVGFSIVFLGGFLFGGRTDVLFLVVLSLTFGLSLGANIATAFKYEETWLSWIVYNIIQLFKAVLQINIANVAKYIYYLFNAVITLGDWKYNGDK